MAGDLIEDNLYMSDMKEAALEYAAKGWPVFPIDPARKSGKEPYRGSHGVLDATTDPKQITKWWTAHPDANIAMDVGGAQMMVLDLDPGHNIKELEKNVGPLPKTKLQARTPRGGRHLFYSLDNDKYVSPSTNKLADHVDVRSFNPMSFCILLKLRMANMLGKMTVNLLVGLTRWSSLRRLQLVSQKTETSGSLQRICRRMSHAPSTG